MDKFQEYVTAALAVLCLVGAFVFQGILLWQGRPEAAMPQWVVALASGFALYYVGNKQGKTQLNGNVSKLADAVTTFVAQRAASTQVTAGVGAPSPAPQPPPPPAPPGGIRPTPTRGPARGRVPAPRSPATHT